jgi:N-acyl-D-aspartate/D-glutamate deacylase
MLQNRFLRAEPWCYLIQNAAVFDGSGADAYTADLLLADGVVKTISRTSLPLPDGGEVIEASGMWVMPGFIDIHTHYDIEIEIDPTLRESVRHGVTTVVMGNCGLSVTVGQPDDLSDMFTRVEGMPSAYVKALLREVKNWDSPSGYYEHLAGLHLGPHVACFLGHSAIRAAVMGLGRSLSAAAQPGEDELRQMNALLEQALEVGYLGLSLNLLTYDKMDGGEFRSRPTPSVFAKWKEYRYLCQTLRQHGRILQTIPNIANVTTYFSFMLESIGLFRKPLKTSMVTMMDGKTVRGLHRIFGGSARLVNTWFGADVKWQGVPVPFDIWVDGMQTPFFEEFEAGGQYLHVIDLEERLDLLRDASYRKRFRRQWRDVFKPRAFHRDLHQTYIVQCPDPSLQGQSFKDVAQRAGKEPVYTFLDLMHKYGDAMRWYTVIGNDRPDVLHGILAHPDFHIGFSDAGGHLRNLAHYNAALRFLKFIRDRHQAGQKTMSLGQAVRKVTSELADWFMLDAGRIALGARADLVVIDPEALDQRVDDIQEEVMPGLPHFKRIVRRNDATVPYVFINGRLAWVHGVASETFGKHRGFGHLLRARP